MSPSHRPSQESGPSCPPPSTESEVSLLSFGDGGDWGDVGDEHTLMCLVPSRARLNLLAQPVQTYPPPEYLSNFGGITGSSTHAPVLRPDALNVMQKGEHGGRGAQSHVRRGGEGGGGIFFHPLAVPPERSPECSRATSARVSMHSMDVDWRGDAWRERGTTGGVTSTSVSLMNACCRSSPCHARRHRQPHQPSILSSLSFLPFHLHHVPEPPPRRAVVVKLAAKATPQELFFWGRVVLARQFHRWFQASRPLHQRGLWLRQNQEPAYGRLRYRPRRRERRPV